MEVKNIESLFAEDLLDGILKSYDGLTEDNFMYYLIVKAINYEKPSNIKRITREKQYEMVIDTIMQDLCIVRYMYDEIPIVKYIALKNSLRNIYDSWIFDMDNFIPTFPGGKFSNPQEALFYINEVITNKIKILQKKEPTKKYHTILNECLNPFFNVSYQVASLKHIPQFIPETIKEENIEYNMGPITEEQIEDYLVSHLSEIEPGLRFISRQIMVPEGRLDIIARDLDNNLVIIEVKNKDDKRLPWQCLYYPKVIPAVYKRNSSKVRMMAIIPDLPKHLRVVLEDINCETICYSIKRKGNELLEMFFTSNNVKKTA